LRNSFPDVQWTPGVPETEVQLMFLHMCVALQKFTSRAHPGDVFYAPEVHYICTWHSGCLICTSSVPCALCNSCSPLFLFLLTKFIKKKSCWGNGGTENCEPLAVL
jgi:hypothetical protein